VDLTASGIADPHEIAERLAAGEWVVDLRNWVAFSPGASSSPCNGSGPAGVREATGTPPSAAGPVAMR
jgi:hypothetical protein